MIKYKISNKKNLGFNFDQTPDLNKVFLYCLQTNFYNFIIFIYI